MVSGEQLTEAGRKRRGAVRDLHVDLVEVDWVAGVEQRVAALVLAENDTIHVLAHEEERWEDFLRRPVLDSLGREVHAAKDAQNYLEVLSGAYSGTYFFATDLHNAGSCAFVDSDQVSLRRVPAPKND